MTFLGRLQKFQQVLTNHQVDYFVIDDPSDLLYLTGLKLSAGKLIFHEKGAQLFVDGRYIENAQKKSPFPVEKVSTNNLVQFFTEKKKQPDTTIGFDSQTTTYHAFQKLEEFLKNHNLNYRLVALEDPLKELRLIKDSAEISTMRKAAQLAWRGFEHVCSSLKEGITERQLALEFEIFCKRNGAEDLAFEPIIAFGANTACPHHHPGARALQENDIVLVDVGVVIDHYRSDMTRVIFWGNPDAELEKLYSIVRRAHNKVLSICRPGVKFSDLDKAARSVFSEEGLEDKFLHSLGHGIGLKTHEYPIIRKDTPESLVLKAGMVFTIEPGLYLEGKGGARYEDTILITQDHYENFYSSTIG